MIRDRPGLVKYLGSPWTLLTDLSYVLAHPQHGGTPNPATNLPSGCYRK